MVISLGQLKYDTQTHAPAAVRMVRDRLRYHEDGTKLEDAIRWGAMP